MLEHRRARGIGRLGDGGCDTIQRKHEIESPCDSGSIPRDQKTVGLVFEPMQHDGLSSQTFMLASHMRNRRAVPLPDRVH
jgi:hypothetical protein